MSKSIKKTLALILSIMMLMSALPMSMSMAVVTADGFVYTNTSTEAMITGYSGSATEIVIPDKIGSCVVVAIGDENGNNNPFYNKPITSVEVPDTVKLIGCAAFMNCKNLETVVLGDGVETICAKAFYGCSLLTTVTIGANVKSIESNAFNNTGITTVNYSGSKAQWEALAGDNGAFANATINCKHDCATDGHKEVEIPGIDATCTAPGATAGLKCEICEAIIKAAEPIPMIPHTPEEAVKEDVISATCETAGSYDSVVYCADCDYEISRETIIVDALGHNVVIDTSNIRFKTEPTCTESGIMIQYCYRCKNGIDGTVAPYGHKEVAIPAVAPSCTEEGSKGGTICSRCETVLTEPETIPVTPHTPDEAVKEEEISATCETAGSYDSVVYCADCDYEISRETIIVDALGHNIVIDTSNIRFKTEPTCTESGIMIQYCYRCNKDIDVTVAPYGHKEVAVEDVASTCTVNGSIGGTKCSVCGEVLVQPTEAPLAEHTRKEGVYEEPTCTENGYKGRVVCGVCNATLEEGEVLPAAHKYELVAEVKPSCEETGSKTYKCTECKDVTVETVDALGHDYPDNWTVILPATCTERGSQIKICSVCNNINSEVIPSLGHTEVVDAAVDPTCTETGLTEGSHCSVCNTVFVEQETVDSLGHTWVDATCTAPKTCSVCSETEGEVLGHSFTNYESNNDATCLEDGTETAKCDRCDVTDTRTDVDSKLGHSFTDYESNNDATCLEDGTETSKCDRCDVTDTRTDVDSKLGHSFTDYESNNDATCLEDGTETAKCDRCDVTDTKTEVDSKLGHSFTDYESNNDATCLEDGTETAKCDRCDVTDTRTDVDSKLGHSFTNYESNNDATCLEDGTETAKCDRCDVTGTKIDVDSALDHAIVPHNAKNPTCTEKGWYAYNTCSRCEYTTYVERASLGHDEVNHVAKAPTCTEIGWYAYETCSRCDYTTYEEIEATGHTEKVIEGVAATCTETGLTDAVVCTVCEEILVDFEEIDPLGHDEIIDEKVSKAPTCTEKGIKKVTCSRCDYTCTEELEAKGHNVTNWITSENATCTKEGLLVGRCIACYSVVREKTDKLQHKDENADKKCDVCGTDLGTQTPEDPSNPSTPSDPEDNPTQPDKPADPENPEGCSCYCHQSGILRFIFFDIPLLFLRIFGLNKTCACGKVHY